MDKGALNAAFSCLEGLYNNQNVGKHVSALLQAGRTGVMNGSHFLPPHAYPFLSFPTPPTSDCKKPPPHSLPQPQLQPPIPPPSITLPPQPHQHQPQIQQDPTNQSFQEAPRKTPKKSIKREPGTENWVQGTDKLSWDGSPVAVYNPATKMFKCVACSTLGFLSRIAEHYLGTHVNAKVFQCPECPYSSAWSRCVRMHMGKHHGVHNAPASLWKGQPLLDEILKLLQNLKNSVEASEKDRPGGVSHIEKRYMCPKCPYATDRRDLYNRHENIHKDDKPFHCYVCFKLFNRADHVKKHFLRIHKNHPYDIHLIRRHPPKTSQQTNTSPLALQWQGCNTTINGSCNGDQEWTYAHNHHHRHHHHHAPVPTKATCNQSSFQQSSMNGAVSQQELGDSKGNNNKKKNAAKTFLCAYCPWRGVDGWCLRRHLNTHIKPFSCMFCEYKAARSERLNTHVLKVHGKHLCNKCHYAGEDSVALERHVKENHLNASLNDRSRMGCSLYPPFPTQPESDAPVNPVHPGMAMKCEPDTCSCSGTNSAGTVDVPPTQISGPTEQHRLVTRIDVDALCRLCGCLFADVPSLQTHMQLMHANHWFPVVKHTTTFPYKCVICGFSCFTQDTMIEHMRLHSGQILKCKAEETCKFSTPFDSVLQDHVLQEHNDESIIRCPHCGYSCNTKQSLVRHCEDFHHMMLCDKCQETVRKHFPITESSNGMCGAKIQNGKINGVKLNGLILKAESKVSQTKRSYLTQDLQVQRFKQSRKQSKPRKVVYYSCSSSESHLQSGKFDGVLHRMAERTKRQTRYKCHLVNGHKLRCKRAYVNNIKCWHCKGVRKTFRCHSSYLIHMLWCHFRKPLKCSKCNLYFKHWYQKYLHVRKNHS